MIVGPFRVLAPTIYASAGVRRSATSMVNYHRLYDGSPIPEPSVIACVDGSELPVAAPLARMQTIEWSIEAFRYAALLTNRDGHGPNSTHLHVEAYRFKEGAKGSLTVNSRFTRVYGVRRHRQRSWVHISPVWLARGRLDHNLLAQLGACTRLHSRQAIRLWRALWWFNRAHHDDPYMPLEFSILSLASAFEALVKPDDKVKGLQAAIAAALGSSEFDDWVAEFYGARSAISHGQSAWQPLFGSRHHIDHYRVATRLFPVLVEHRLVELRRRPAGDPFIQSMHRHVLTQLLHADADLIDRLVPHTFRSLRLRRNRDRRLELKFLSVRLNADDLSTQSEKYEELLEWLRRIAVSMCRSAAARWPDDKAAFGVLRQQFARGMPSISTAVTVPLETDETRFFDDLSHTPEHRSVLIDISLAELGDAMREVEWRRQMAHLRGSAG